jgi:hypothetical protein
MSGGCIGVVFLKAVCKDVFLTSGSLPRTLWAQVFQSQGYMVQLTNNGQDVNKLSSWDSDEGLRSCLLVLRFNFWKFSWNKRTGLRFF